mgnify:CR=1 FL=1|jgi:hypothetical protein
MTRRPLALAAVLATAACAGRTPAPAAPRTAAVPTAPAPPRDPATLAYGVGTARYRVEQATHVVQEVMGQVNTTDLSSHQVLSAVVTQGAGNLAMALTVDSIEMSDPTGVAGAGAAAARGQTFRLVFAPSGLAISTTAPDSTNPVFRQISTGLSDLLPRLPSSPIAAGQTWSDTLTQSASTGVSTRFVRQHRVVGWEDRDGARALHITTTSNYTVTGTTEAQGQSIELNGNGVSTRDAFVSAAGLFLGSVESDSALVNANVTAMGLVVPVRQARRSTITRIP